MPLRSALEQIFLRACGGKYIFIFPLSLYSYPCLRCDKDERVARARAPLLPVYVLYLPLPRKPFSRRLSAPFVVLQRRVLREPVFVVRKTALLKIRYLFSSLSLSLSLFFSPLLASLVFFSFALPPFSLLPFVSPFRSLFSPSVAFRSGRSVFGLACSKGPSPQVKGDGRTVVPARDER